MTDPTPTPTPQPAPLPVLTVWHGIYDELKTLTLGFALGVAMVGWHLVPVPTPSPVPPIPVPIPTPPQPVPVPPPIPVPPPPPPVPPAPAWGPLDKILIMYESSKLSGKEAFFALPVRQALDSTATADPTTRLPNWRIWDQDVDASREPSWADAMAKAKAEFKAADAPVLFAVDQQGRVKTVPLKGLSDADAATAIKALGGK